MLHQHPVMVGVTDTCYVLQEFLAKFFTDITMPAKQSYSPNTGKISAIETPSLL